MPVEAYLIFNGRCEEAIEFYKKSLGAEMLMMMRFREAPEPPPPGMVPANWDNKVMHGCLRIGDGNVMLSDGCGEAGSFQGFSLSLPATDEADAHRKFAALAEGGEVQMPLGKTFWSPCFGMVTDRFGVGWMVGVEASN